MPLHLHTRSVVSKPKFVRSLIVALCGVAAVTTSAYSVSKRHALTRKSTVVAVMQHDKLAKGAKTVIMLRHNGTPHTVILVDPQATPSDLAGAFSAVTRFRDKLADSLQQRDMMLVPKPLQGRHLSLGAEERMKKYLTALGDNRNMKRIAGVGDGRAISVVLSTPGK